MFVKFVLLLFCCALINAKTLVQRNPRHDVKAEEDKGIGKFPGLFKDLIRNAENNLERSEDNKVGASPQVQAEEDDISDDDSNEEPDNEVAEEHEEVEKKSENEVDEKNVKDENKVNNDDDNNDDDGDEDEDEEEEEEEEEEDKKDKQDEEKRKNENKQEEQNDEEDEEDEIDSDETENKEDNQNKKKEENKLENDSSESESDEEGENFNKPSFATVGAEPQSPKSFDFTAAQLNLFQQALQNPAINKHVNKLTNLVDWPTMAKNFLPSLEAFLPNKIVKQPELNFYDMDEETLKKNIDVMERNNANAENEFTETRKSIPKIEFDLNDLNLDPAVGDFISQAIPENIKNLQIPAKLQGLSDMWMKNVQQHFKAPVQKEPKVGFGGWNKQQKAVFGDLTPYVNKAVEQAQTKLENNGRSIEANNPPLTINVIPQTPITFKLKRVEGAHTIDKYGQSRAIRYNKLYAFTQYKFNELRYYYDVIIEPFKLFGIRKSITIILNDARTRMNLAVEKDNKMNVLGLEFVNPEVMVDCNTDRFTNYAVNYLINDVHRVIKQKVVEIVSRDSKLLLTNYLKDAE